MHTCVQINYSFYYFYFSDLQTQLNLQNMDSCFIGIICSSYNTDTTTMVRILDEYIENVII